jgi:hypothetical protein
MKIYLAGTPSGHREHVLINAGVMHRLVTFALKTDTVGVLRKWGKVPEKKK